MYITSKCIMFALSLRRVGREARRGGEERAGEGSERERESYHTPAVSSIYTTYLAFPLLADRCLASYTRSTRLLSQLDYWYSLMHRTCDFWRDRPALTNWAIPPFFELCLTQWGRVRQKRLKSMFPATLTPYLLQRIPKLPPFLTFFFSLHKYTIGNSVICKASNVSKKGLRY